MLIEHIALWTHDLERLRGFYCRYFSARSGAKYHNPKTGFESYFLSFDSGARLELMQMPGIPKDSAAPQAQRTGLIHIAIRLGNPEAVDRMTARMRQNGVPVVSGPRRTGDGYYESCILDPEGNRVELVA